MSHLDDAALDAIERDFGGDVRARREHDPATQAVLKLTAAVREARGAATDAEQRAQTAEEVVARVRDAIYQGGQNAQSVRRQLMDLVPYERGLGDDQQETT